MYARCGGSGGICERLDLPCWRQHTDNEKMTITDLEISKISIGRISQTFIQPFELRQLIDSIGYCYRWFAIIKNRVTDEAMVYKLAMIIQDSCWMDSLERQI